MSEESDQTRQRRDKLKVLRDRGNPFPNDFRRDAFVGDLMEKYAEDPDGVSQQQIRVKVAGRLMSRRIMGYAH